MVILTDMAALPTGMGIARITRRWLTRDRAFTGIADIASIIGRTSVITASGVDRGFGNSELMGNSRQLILLSEIEFSIPLAARWDLQTRLPIVSIARLG